MVKVFIIVTFKGHFGRYMDRKALVGFGPSSDVELGCLVNMGCQVPIAMLYCSKTLSLDVC